MNELALGQRAAIESLLKIAVRDTGQSRRVADFRFARERRMGPRRLVNCRCSHRQRYDDGVGPDPSRARW